VRNSASQAARSATKDIFAAPSSSAAGQNRGTEAFLASSTATDSVPQDGSNLRVDAFSKLVVSTPVEGGSGIEAGAPVMSTNGLYSAGNVAASVQMPYGALSNGRMTN
jgi:hypothetical protein